MFDADAVRRRPPPESRRLPPTPTREYPPGAPCGNPYAPVAAKHARWTRLGGSGAAVGGNPVEPQDSTGT